MKNAVAPLLHHHLPHHQKVIQTLTLANQIRKEKIRGREEKRGLQRNYLAPTHMKFNQTTQKKNHNHKDKGKEDSGKNSTDKDMDTKQ